MEPAAGVRETLRLVQYGALVNVVLALVKLLAGVVGNSYALIADGVESSADVLGSLVVWSGVRIAARSADDAYPFGYGKAEALAATVVGLMLAGAATGIGIASVREIRTPHHAPAPFTLAVLVGVILVKEFLFRRMGKHGVESGSTAATADAWHHRSDAITSAAAFIGISLSLLAGPGWESADDWAALVAGAVILVNAVGVMRPAIHELMDKAPDAEIQARVARAARSVDGVCLIEKLKVRKAGTNFWVDLHVQADPALSLHDAHILSGRVKSAIRAVEPRVVGALIHMEPFEAPTH